MSKKTSRTNRRQVPTRAAVRALGVACPFRRGDALTGAYDGAEWSIEFTRPRETGFVVRLGGLLNCVLSLTTEVRRKFGVEPATKRGRRG